MHVLVTSLYHTAVHIDCSDLTLALGGYYLVVYKVVLRFSQAPTYEDKLSALWHCGIVALSFVVDTKGFHGHEEGCYNLHVLVQSLCQALL